MSAPLDGIANYSAFVYTVAERHPFVRFWRMCCATGFRNPE